MAPVTQLSRDLVGSKSQAVDPAAVQASYGLAL